MADAFVAIEDAQPVISVEITGVGSPGKDGEPGPQGPPGVSPEPVHINLKDNYGIDLVQQVLENTMSGKMEFIIPFPSVDEFFENINAAQGSIWIDIAISDTNVYSALVCGKVVDNTGINWIDIKISVLEGGLLAGFVIFSRSSIFVKVTDVPAID